MSAQRNFASKSLLQETFRSQRGLITLGQARDLGHSPSAVARKVKSGEWIKVSPTVFRSAAVPVTWHQTLLAAYLYGGEGTLVSHRSAGALWKLDGLQPGPIEILTARRLRSPGLTVHRATSIPSTDRKMSQGIPVTSIERTLIDLAGCLNEAGFEIALDSALRMQMTTIPRLRRRLDTFQISAAGRGTLRYLLDQRCGGRVSESALETKLIRAIRSSSLPPPTLQHKVMDGDRCVGRFDLAYPDAKVIVEVDGYRWHTGRAAWHRDRKRDNHLNRLGWTVLRFTADDLKDLDAVVDQIRDALWPRLGR